MNACITVVKYMYIYTACDSILLLHYYHVWLTLHGRLASGLYTQPLALTVLLIT